MIKEFRRAKRREAPDTILVTDTMTERVIGRIGNLSQTGLLLLACEPLAADALYQVRFTLPGIDGDATAVNVGAHLLWVDGASAPGQAWAGFRFIAVPAAHAKRIRTWIESVGS